MASLLHWLSGRRWIASEPRLLRAHHLHWLTSDGSDLLLEEINAVTAHNQGYSGNGVIVAMLDTAVNSLDNLEPLIPDIKGSGARHAGYGVKDEDYGKVADAIAGQYTPWSPHLAPWPHIKRALGQKKNRLKAARQYLKPAPWVAQAWTGPGRRNTWWCWLKPGNVMNKHDTRCCRRSTN